MFEDFPCALTPAERKALASALGQGFFRQPLTGVKGLLTVVGTVAACALMVCVWAMLDHWRQGFGLTLFLACSYLGTRFMLQKRDALIRKLYAHITSVADEDAPADSPSSAQS